MLKRQLLDIAAIRAVCGGTKMQLYPDHDCPQTLLSISEQSVVPLASSRAAASEWVSRALRAAGP